MRLALLLVAVCALMATCTMAATATSATYGQALSVAANTFTQFGFTGGLPPLVGISSSTATTLTVNSVAQLAASAQLPDGIQLSGIQVAGVSVSTLVGLQVQVSTSASSVSQVAITLPAITASQQSSLNAGLLGILYIDASSTAYATIPPSQIQVNSDNTVSFKYTSPGYFYVVSFSTAPIVGTITNGVTAFRVAANASLTYSVYVSAQAGQKAFDIVNFTASAAGTITVSASAQAQAETTATVTEGRAVLSQVYNITYSNAASTKSGVLVFYAGAANGVRSSVNAATVAWYRLEHGTSVWVQQASTVNGDFSASASATVSVSVNGFSDWSVQATNSSSSSSSSGSGFSSTGGNPGAASALAPVALLVAALCGLLMA